ncbi:hypothetical protein ACIP5L_22740 [Streptomyces bacillaris]|uniref:hypothetical protein n=1 Tax=Streptomyces bacillaris TaxID=68179 RepID=UPI0038025AB3
MSDIRCERCELIVGAGCSCPTNGSPPRVARSSSAPQAPRAGWPRNAIIISEAGNAHYPGCNHLSDSEIRAPKFGWVTDPAPNAWRLIAEERPLHATQGNVDRIAVRRCQTCAEYH